jgi:hypothetical protein
MLELRFEGTMALHVPQNAGSGKGKRVRHDARGVIDGDHECPDAVTE